MIKRESIQVNKENYYVEYYPADELRGWLAAVQLVYIKETLDLSSIQIDINEEVKYWLEKYPVPLIATAFNNAGGVIHVRKDMQKMGATVIDVNLPLFNNDRQNNQAGEIQDVNEYLSSFPSTRKNFRDICESNRTRNFGTIKDCLHFIKNMPSKSSKPYQKAQSIFDKNKIYVQKVMKINNLDALLIPITTKGTSTYDGMTVNTWRAPVSSNSGLPSININVGYSAETNMPIGIELVGKQFHEGTLIEIAYAYEMQAPKKINPIMPEENSALLNLSVPELNNLFTLLGKNAYEEVLIHNKGSSDVASDLTPERFKKITSDTIEKLKVNLKLQQTR